MKTKKCPGCGRSVFGHKNKKFCGQRCKDNYHNTVNPRGYGLYNDYREEALSTAEGGWDGHKF